ncbi:CopG family transcriptional regulator [Iningainema tapete]|uniref:CopG family transcriptional regulator n=1 Tax=Iningainema tapete BLCC-T55 TaxID=2748662 RepID=A0A8J7CFW9_9CYAN|nr:CopG family transcriptional regulator [Iningainema tapete]MBD2775515.1 CopG family transcriptional regulator [Iningainema tapete BLCC-T55]
MSKKLTVKQITVDLELEEAKKLEKYCHRTNKAATEVIRQLIRELPTT